MVLLVNWIIELNSFSVTYILGTRPVIAIDEPLHVLIFGFNKLACFLPAAHLSRKGVSQDDK